jgi:hypothetical protein
MPGSLTISLTASQLAGAPLIKSDAQGCYGTGGYGDLQPNTAVIVKDREGQQVAVGFLQAGHLAAGNTHSCVMPFVVPDVPSGLTSYSAMISHRGTQVESPDVATAGVYLCMCG